MTDTPWGIHRLSDMIAPRGIETRLPSGRWVRSVPEPYTANRLVAAWWVLTGRAYAVRWPQDGELEDALASVPLDEKEG